MDNILIKADKISKIYTLFAEEIRAVKDLDYIA